MPELDMVMTRSPPIESVTRALHVLRIMNQRDVTSVNDLNVALAGDC